MKHSPLNYAAVMDMNRDSKNSIGLRHYEIKRKRDRVGKVKYKEQQSSRRNTKTLV
jgi:hypothetical protein